jgi:hypothetical protein
LLPSDGIPREDRDGWLDGMRGVAALQVMLLHYATAFLPGLGLHNRGMMHQRWERIIADTPSFFALNGYGSVYLFFLLSGVVLTYSFARRPFAAVQWTLRRIIRLACRCLGRSCWSHSDFGMAHSAHRGGQDQSVFLLARRGIAPGGSVAPA